MTLNYAPIGVDSGTLALSYSYTDNAGTAKTGAVSIPYASTVHDTVVGMAAPIGQITANVGDSSQMVAVTFTTSDGNAATSLAMTTDLSALPTGWSSSSLSFTCSTVSSGNGCVLNLAYMPSTAASGTLSLAYTYLDNSGSSLTGTVNVAYTSQLIRAYISNQGAQMVLCQVRSDGGFANCATQPTPGVGGVPQDVVFTSSYAYIADQGSSVDACPVNSDGTFGSCIVAASGFGIGAGNLAVNGNVLYVPNSGNYNSLQYCTLVGDGTVTGCTSNNTNPSDQVFGVAFDGNVGYIGAAHDNGQPGFLECSLGGNGSLSSCVTEAAGVIDAALDIVRVDSHLYTTSLNQLGVCQLNSDGTLGTCVTQGLSIGSDQMYMNNGLAVLNGRAWIPYDIPSADGFSPDTYGIAVCAVAQVGSISGCADSGYTSGQPISISLR